MLSSENRFHGPNSLRFVYRNGQTVHSRNFKLKYVANSRLNSPRFAIVISKKVHKSAVGRNQIRRRFYEAIRSELPRLKPVGMDVAIIIVSGEALSLPFTDITAMIEQSFKEASLYK